MFRFWNKEGAVKYGYRENHTGEFKTRRISSVFFDGGIKQIDVIRGENMYEYRF